MSDINDTLAPNHAVIQILGDTTDPDAMYTIENSSFGADDGEWNLRLILSLYIEALNLTCCSMTGGLRLSDIPEESYLKALDDTAEQAKRLIDEASNTLSQELLNPDSAARVVNLADDEGYVPSNEPNRIPTPQDMQP